MSFCSLRRRADRERLLLPTPPPPRCRRVAHVVRVVVAEVTPLAHRPHMRLVTAGLVVTEMRNGKNHARSGHRAWLAVPGIASSAVIDAALALALTAICGALLSD